MPDLAASKTIENLRAAIAAAAERSLRYRWLAGQAEREGHPKVAELLRSIADSTEEHAVGNLDLLDAGSTRDGVLSAIEDRTYETTELLPGWATTARDEGFDDVADRLETIARAERSYASRLTHALEGLPVDAGSGG